MPNNASAKIKGTETLKKGIGEELRQVDIKKSYYKGICSFDVIIEDKNLSTVIIEQLSISTQAAKASIDRMNRTRR